VTNCTTNDGGPAFPVESTSTPWAEGMSLRDWFAGHALAGILANPNHRIGEITFERIGKDAYIFADAMLSARKETDDAR
jgi:hypothetical protein